MLNSQIFIVTFITNIHKKLTHISNCKEKNTLEDKMIQIRIDLLNEL